MDGQDIFNTELTMIPREPNRDEVTYNHTIESVGLIGINLDI